MFYEDTLYRSALKHEVGRELCYDMFFLLAKNIEDVPNKAQGETHLEALVKDIAILKVIVSDVCRIVVKHKRTKHEDGRDFFTAGQWKELYSKVKHDRFIEERRAIEKGRAFVTAFNTPMGTAIEECILRGVQTGYELINTGDISMEGVYKMNIYRTMSLRWEEKILAYKKNIERVRKIIYKENSE